MCEDTRYITHHNIMCIALRDESRNRLDCVGMNE
jgi:hypothetical protein